MNQRTHRQWHGFRRLPKNRNGASRRYLGAHIFDRVCTENGIEHKLTKPYHPWTNGQAERMNRTIKEATVKVFHYPSLESLKAHVLAFVTAYNFAKHLKALRWKTPFEAMCAAWTKDPEAFIIDPRHLQRANCGRRSLARNKERGAP
jgi:transposase InsO family protein